MTITIPPELEQVIEEQADRQGTTAELLALEGLTNQFLSHRAPSPPAGTLADYLGDFIGCLHSGELVPGGAQMSIDTGRKFAAEMLKKRQAGRL